MTRGKDLLGHNEGFEGSALELVTVVVVNWNRWELLRACLRSLSEQSYRPFEVVLVDNGSTDGSAGKAELEFGGQLRLQVIRNQENRGFCAANNQGIAAARGQFIALLNNDAEADGMARCAPRSVRAAGSGNGGVENPGLGDSEPD